MLTTSTVVCLVSQEEVGEGGDGDRTLADTAGKKWKKNTASWRPVVDGEHAGDEDALPDAYGTAMARSLWWLYLPGNGGGGRGKP